MRTRSVWPCRVYKTETPGPAREEVAVDLTLASELGVAPRTISAVPPISHRPNPYRPRGAVTSLLYPVETPLVLVEAGAGYGKTTASRQLVDQERGTSGWLGLDPDDDDPIVLSGPWRCSRRGSRADAAELLYVRSANVRSGMERRAIRELPADASG